MRKLTIAQRREAQLQAFNEKYIHDMETARRLFNSYYRYVALDYRVFEMDNDSSIYGSRYHKEQTAKRDKWYSRLSAELKKYDISIYTPWTISFLGKIDPVTGCVTESVIEPILY